MHISLFAAVNFISEPRKRKNLQDAIASKIIEHNEVYQKSLVSDFRHELKEVKKSLIEFKMELTRKEDFSYSQLVTRTFYNLITRLQTFFSVINRYYWGLYNKIKAYNFWPT